MTDLFFYLVMRMLIANEGFEAQPYKIDDVWHIGYGYNLEAHMPNPPCADYECLIWTKAEAFNQLSGDVRRINKRLSVRYSCYRMLPEKGKIVILDMAYHMGIRGMLKFKDFLASMCAKNYRGAGNHIKDSKYYNDVTRRALRNIEILKNGIDL
tara:strand:+ start:46885 stop:47346 length:462 start_codon:yes stop_codon:yes gene_type:complete